MRKLNTLEIEAVNGAGIAYDLGQAVGGAVGDAVSAVGGAIGGAIYDAMNELKQYSYAH